MGSSRHRRRPLIRAIRLSTISRGRPRQEDICLYGIRFVIDKKQEKEQEAKKEKERRRAEMKDFMSDFISSTHQRLEELEKQRLHDRKEFERIRAQDRKEFEKELQSKQSQIVSLLSTLSQVQQKSESDQLSCVSARVSGGTAEVSGRVQSMYEHTVSHRAGVLSVVGEHVDVSCDVSTMSSTLMTSVPSSLWRCGLSCDAMMFGLVSVLRFLQDGCVSCDRDREHG
ncbi:hypothetical protein ADUPG1_000707, partial [Aduncisulcus paluster]